MIVPTLAQCEEGLLVPIVKYINFTDFIKTATTTISKKKKKNSLIRKAKKKKKTLTLPYNHLHG